MVPVVRLIAHRGDPAHAPENTLASFRQAIARGARAVEMDIRRSQDGRWLIFHDATLRRMTGRIGLVSKTRWGSLRTLRVRGEERIPLLSEGLALCRWKGCRAFLDIKVNGWEPELLRLLRRSGSLARVILGVGDRSALQRWRRLAPGCPIFWVGDYEKVVTDRRIGQAARLRLTGLAVYKRSATKAAVRKVHAAGLKLYVWTVRTPEELRRFARRGADGIMSEVWPPPSI